MKRIVIGNYLDLGNSSDKDDDNTESIRRNSLNWFKSSEREFADLVNVSDFAFNLQFV